MKRFFQGFTLSAFVILISVNISFAQDYKVLSTLSINADGPGGAETHKIIRDALGYSSLETPDLYAKNHTTVKHIFEETDKDLENRFTFIMHLEEDHDRNLDPSDRQRNEIKAYNGSRDEAKAFNNEEVRYRWYCQIGKGLKISKNFCHFFQLKAFGGSQSSQPLVTISGSINGGEPQLEFMHSKATNSDDVQLANTNWSKVNNGEWLEIDVIAKFSDNGYLSISIKNLDGDTILSVEKNDIDMWRTGADYIRPKWGIYRSTKSKEMLNPTTDSVRYANFLIHKIDRAQTGTNPGISKLVAPTDNAQEVPTSPTLNWEAGHDATKHIVYLATDSSKLSENRQMISFGNKLNPARLELNTTYYWRVDAYGYEGYTQGEVWKFTTTAKRSILHGSTVTSKANVITPYPNPAEDFIYINTNTLVNRSCKVEIFNNIGQIVKSHTISGLPPYKQGIDVSELAPGAYLIQFKTKNESFSGRFLKK